MQSKSDSVRRIPVQQGMQQQQMAFDNTVFGLHAVGQFDASAAAFFESRGFGAVVDNGAGDFTITLTNALDLAGGDGVVLATTHAGAAAQVDVAFVSATQIRVRVFDAAAMAADIDFSLAILAISPA